MNESRDSIRVEYTTQDGQQNVLYPEGEVVLKPEGMEGVAVKVVIDPPSESGADLDRCYIVVPWERIDEIEYRPEGFTGADTDEEKP